MIDKESFLSLQVYKERDRILHGEFIKQCVQVKPLSLSQPTSNG